MVALVGVWGQEKVICNDYTWKHQNIGRRSVKLSLLRWRYLPLYLFLNLPRPHWLFWLKRLGAFGSAIQTGCQGRGMDVVTQWLLHWVAVPVPSALLPHLSRREGKCQPALLRGIVLSSCTILCPGMPLLPSGDPSPCSLLLEQENTVGILSALPASSSRKTLISPTMK